MLEILDGDRRDYGPQWPSGMGPPLTWGDWTAIVVSVGMGVCLAIGLLLGVLWWSFPV